MQLSQKLVIRELNCYQFLMSSFGVGYNMLEVELIIFRIFMMIIFKETMESKRILELRG